MHVPLVAKGNSLIKRRAHQSPPLRGNSLTFDKPSKGETSFNGHSPPRRSIPQTQIRLQIAGTFLYAIVIEPPSTADHQVSSPHARRLVRNSCDRGALTQKLDIFHIIHPTAYLSSLTSVLLLQSDFQTN